MVDKNYYYSVANTLTKSQKKAAYAVIRDNNDDATIIQKITMIAGSNPFSDRNLANNPTAEAAAAIKAATSDNSAQAQLPNNYDSSLEAINTMDAVLGTQTTLNPVKDAAGTVVPNNVIASVNAVDDRVGDTSAVILADKFGTEYTQTDVATYIGAVNGKIGNIAPVTTLNNAGASSSNASAAIHITNLKNNLGDTPSVITYSNGGASHAQTDVATHLTDLASNLGDTSGVLIKDKSGVPHTNTDVATLVSNADGKVGDVTRLQSGGDLQVLSTSGVPLPSGSDLVTAVGAHEARIGDTSTLQTVEKVIVPAINDIIQTINLLTGLDLATTINSAFMNVDNTIGEKPLITSLTYENSLSGGINILKLAAGTVNLNSNFAKDNVNSYANMATLLRTLLANPNNYASSEVLATAIVGAITPQESSAPLNLSIATLKADIDATVSGGGRSLADIATNMITNLLGVTTDTGVVNAVYNGTNTIIGSASHQSSLLADVDASQLAGNIVTISSAFGSDSIQAVTGVAAPTLTQTVGNTALPISYDKNGNPITKTLSAFAAATADKVGNTNAVTVSGGTPNDSVAIKIETLNNNIGDLNIIPGSPASVVAYLGTTPLEAGGATNLAQGVNNAYALAGTRPVSLPYYYPGLWDYIGYHDYGSSGTLTSLVGSSPISNVASTLTGAVGNTAISAIQNADGSAVDDTLSAVVVASDAKFGGLTTLTTTAKNTVVAAINEIDADGWVTTSKIAAGAVMGTQLSAGANLLGTQLSAGADIHGSQLSAGANLLGTQLSAGADIHGSQLSAGANLVGTQLSAGAGITNGQITSITGTKISDATLIGTQLSAGANIAGTQLSAGAAIKSGQIALATWLNPSTASWAGNVITLNTAPVGCTTNTMGGSSGTVFKTLSASSVTAPSVGDHVDISDLLVITGDCSAYCAGGTQAQYHGCLTTFFTFVY